MNSEKSYYDILKVNKNASEAEIKKSYRKIILECHPDRLPEEKREWGEKMTKEVNEAWTILQNQEKRELYDQFGKEGLEGGGMHGGMPGGMPGGMNDIINEMMRQTQGHGQGRSRQSNVPPVKVVQNVSLEDIYNGKKTNINIDRYTMCSSCDATGFSDKQKHDCDKCNGTGFTMHMQQIGPGFIQQMQRPCKDCSGSGRDTVTSLKCDSCDGDQVIKENVEIEFSVPKGVKDRDVVQIANLGNEIPIEDRHGGGITRGPVHVFINELEHDVFKRGIVINQKMNPANICIVLDITLADTIMGFNTTIDHLDGRKIYFRENLIVKDGDIRVILNEGLPIKGKEFAKGDLFIKYNVKVPNNLSDEQRMGIYKILTGNDYVDVPVPEEYNLTEKFNIDEYISCNTDSDDSNDGQNNGPGECRTQ